MDGLHLFPSDDLLVKRLSRLNFLDVLLVTQSLWLDLVIDMMHLRLQISR